MLTAKKSASEETISIDGLTVRKIMPHGYPFQMFDRVEAYNHAKGHILAIKNVAQNDPFIQGHFPGNPIFPGVLLIEALAQAAGCGWVVGMILDSGVEPDKLGDDVGSTMELATILAESKIKHTNPVFPGDQVILEATSTFKRDDLCQCKVLASVRGTEVTKGTLTMARVPHSLPEGLTTRNGITAFVAIRRRERAVDCRVCC